MPMQTAGNVDQAADASGPVVTVVIPTYNRAALLPRAIASVLRQTYRHFELIVVDDGSTDATEGVVRSIADPRVRYLRHERNKGLPAARNSGIRAARGDYIAFLDDDDEWRPAKLEKQLSAVRDYDAVVCTAAVNGVVLRKHKRRSVSLDDLRRGTFVPSGLLARAHVLRDVPFDESLRQGEDWDGFIRIAQRYSVGCVPEPLVIYHEGSPARMTDEARALSGPELERRAAVLYKHREFLGEAWFRYHLADACLSFLRGRRDKRRCLAYAIRRCGALPVAAVLAQRARRRLRRILGTRLGMAARAIERNV